MLFRLIAESTRREWAMAIHRYPAPTRRPLNVYAVDPQAGDQPGNKVAIDVPFERLGPGPAGSVLEVIDYDHGTGTYYQPVELDRLETLIQGGLPHAEGDPRFHQQMVYAVAMRVLENFGNALGRPIRFLRQGIGYQPLRLIPHAFEQANAYFDHELHAVLFGYFTASETNPGRNLPGQTIFTCLSHDIIAHEMTHAILHRQRGYFIYPTNVDALAFHEGFADIVAIFQRLTFREVVQEHIASFRGDLNAGSLADLAQQFGAALGRNAALRSAVGEVPPDPTRLSRTHEPHARGAILLAAVFDAFVKVYRKRTADLLRIATGGSGVLPDGNLHPDLVQRLTTEAIKAAQSMLNMCIRAIDYLPPVDITYGDFLRAIVTADAELVHEDRLGQRDIVIEAFRARGIYPQSVVSLAPKSIVWQQVSEFPELPNEIVKNFWRALSMESAVERERFDEEKSASRMTEHLYTIDSEDLDPEDASDGDRETKQKIARALWGYAKENADDLGLSRDVKIRVHGFHPNVRVSPNGRWRAEFVVTFIQEMGTEDEQKMRFGGLPVVGGTTLIADGDGKVRYVLRKPLPKAAERFRNEGVQRIAQQVAFVDELDARDPLFSWGDAHYLERRMSLRSAFNALHACGPSRY